MWEWTGVWVGEVVTKAYPRSIGLWVRNFSESVYKDLTNNPPTTAETVENGPTAQPEHI